MSATASEHLFVVRYRRQAWRSAQVKRFSSWEPAERLVRRLLTPDPRWSPLVFVEVTRFRLSDPEVLLDWREGAS